MEQDTMPYSHTIPNFETEVEREIYKFLQDYAAAVRGGNIEEILRFYTKEVVAFDMMPPLIVNGVHKYRENWEKCFTNYFDFPVQYDFSHVRIVAGPEAAFCHCLAHMRGTSRDGKEMNANLRSTICLQNVDGAWIIVHEHNSVPLDESGKGLMNMEPNVSIH